MQRIRGWVARHPWVVDTGVAVLTAAVVATEPSTPAGGPLGWVALAAGCAPLVWRRRAPVVVAWAVLGLAAVSLTLDLTGAHLFLAPLVAVYAVARHRPRRYLWPIVAVIVVPVSVGWLWAGGQWYDLAAMFAILAATVLLAQNLRTRRAYLDQLEERARRLERERDQQARLAVADERARIAREMHDIVAHNLAVMVALADGAGFAATTSPERAADAMEKISGTGREALAEMRRLVGLLRDDDADPRAPQPGLDDLDRLVEQVRAAGLTVAVTRQGEPGAWTPGAGLAVYRIVQEALTNTLKHAGPRARAQVRLSYQPGSVDLEVIDDGAGQPARAAAVPSEGHGVVGMVERAAPYGGQVEAGPAPGTGWRVRARLRLDGAAVDSGAFA